MCGVYFMGEDLLADVESMTDHVDSGIDGTFFDKDIHPTDMAPILIGKHHSLFLTRQRWGYPGVVDKGVIINARAETAAKKRVFQNGLRYHRGVIPATHFYEWNENHEKHTFSRKDERPLFMAGFFDMLDNEERFVILTTRANASMEKVHERMPLVLEEEQVRPWILDPAYTEMLLDMRPAELKSTCQYKQLSLFEL